jgi:hypothetical protein
METEYQVINEWRNNVITCSYIMTSIFIPATTGIFFSYYFIENLCRPPQYIFLLTSIILIFFWRFYDLRIDREILNIYPRIYFLEENLNYRFTREYLTHSFLRQEIGNNNPLPPLNEIERIINEYRQGREYYHPRNLFLRCKRSRGHVILNWFALTLIFGEGIICFL